MPKITSINSKIIFSYAILFVFVIGINPINQTVSPTDLLVSFPGWKNLNVYPGIVENPYASDIIDGQYPHWIKLKKDLYNGKIETWSKLRAGGVPFLSLTNILPSLFIFLLIPNNTFALYIICLFKLIFCSFGMFKLLEDSQFSVFSSFFGGIIFSMGGFMAAWHFVSPFEVGMMLPYILYSTSKFLHLNKIKYLFYILLSSFFCIVSWFPSVSVYCYYILTIFILLYFIGYNNIRKFAKYAFLIYCSIFLSFTLSAFFLINWIELFDFIDISYRKNSNSFIPLKNLFSLIRQNSEIAANPETSMYFGYIPIIFTLLSVPLFFAYAIKGHYLKSMFKFRLQLLSMLVFTLAFIIIFGILDRKLVNLIPTFSYNLTTRLIFCFGFCIAISSSFTFDCLLLFMKRQRIRTIFSIFIILFSTVSLTVNWRDFVSRVDVDTFYPSTKTLNHINSNLKFYDSVVADMTYMIPGTLSAYNIPEWFAHMFRNKSEKDFFSKIHKLSTPTSFLLNIDNIDINNQNLFDILNVKYILTSKPLSVVQKIINTNEDKIPIRLNRDYLYTSFHQEIDTKISGISVKIGNYNSNKNQYIYDVTISIIDEDSGLLLYEEIFSEKIVDNVLKYFHFKSPILLSSNINYKLGIKNNKPDLKLALWTDKHKSFDVAFMDTNSIIKSNGWKIYSLEDGIYILENIEYSEGPFYVPSLESNIPKKFDFTFQDLSDKRILISITETLNDGYIVFPQRWYPGWTANLNNSLQEIQKYKGFMPCIRVNSETRTIALNYKSKNISKGFMISLLSLIICIVCYIVFPKYL